MFRISDVTAPIVCSPCQQQRRLFPVRGLAVDSAENPKPHWLLAGAVGALLGLAVGYTLGAPTR